MKRLVVIVVALASLVGGVSVAYAAKVAPLFSAPRHDTPATYPFSCTTGSFFQTLAGQLSSSPNLRTWTTIGTVTSQVNALAYSPTTNYLYAIDETAGPDLNDLVQINSQGTQTVLGSIAGLPSKYNWNGGDIDPATNTYYVSPGDTKLYAINLTTRVAAPVAVPARVKIGFDLVVQQGWIWSVTTTGVNGFSLTTGSTKLFTIPKSDFGDATGSIWGDLAHDGLYFRWDNTGKTFHVTGLRATAITISLVGTTPTHEKMNDGATCNAASTPGPDTAPVLQIAGSSVAGIGPGKLVRLDLTLTNTYAAPVSVWPSVIKLSLSDSSSACPASTNFNVVKGVSDAFTVPANSTKTLEQLGLPSSAWPLISMVDTSTNQDACEGTTLTVSYYVRYFG